MTTVLRKALTCLVVLFSVAVLSQAKPEKNAPTAPATGQKSPAADDPNYIIGPQDALSISVWKEAEVSGQVIVRPDGMISVPLLNDIQAAGMTPLQLTASITEKLKQFISDPRVTVIVAQTNSQRIFVMGEVLHVGAFPLVPDMTVLQAIANAGGPTPYAKTGKIYVLRKTGSNQQKFNFDYKAVLRGEKQEQNIVLKPGDTVVIP